jgi:hypothetical protein
MIEVGQDFSSWEMEVAGDDSDGVASRRWIGE